jgi:hypothetical protein
MMTVYEVVDDENGIETFYRTKAEAEEAVKYVLFGRLARYRIATPITKDTVLRLLNREAFASEIEHLADINHVVVDD